MCQRRPSLLLGYRNIQLRNVDISSTLLASPGLLTVDYCPPFTILTSTSDSLVRNRERNGNIPPLSKFSFDAGVSQVAPQIRSYLVAVPPRSLLTEVQRLAHLRPPPTPAEPDPLSMSRETQPQAVAVETLMRDRDHTFKSIITDYSHFLSVRDQYVGLNDKRGRTAVPDAVDFPIDVAGERKLVEELFGAMLDFGEVIDEQRQRRSKKRKAVDAAEDPEMEVSFTDSTHVRRVKEASNLEIELLAWDLVVSNWAQPPIPSSTLRIR